MNCHFNNQGQLVYPAAAVGIIYDYNEHTQKYFGGGLTQTGGRKQKDTSKGCHTDDIMSLTISDSRKLVASGQNGQCPTLMVWKADDCELVDSFKLPKGSRMVSACAISGDDKYIVAADAAEKVMAYVFEIGGKKKAIRELKIAMRVLHISFNPFNSEQVTSVGKNHMMLFNGSQGKRGKGTTYKTKQGNKTTSHCCVAWSHKASSQQEFFTGGTDGKLYHWKGTAIMKSMPSNKGAVNSICVKPDGDNEVIVTGGADKGVTIFSFDGKTVKQLNTIAFPDASCRSIDIFNGNILFGMSNGEVEVAPFSTDLTMDKVK
jgi:microtubule-associated protein-like 6